MDTPEQPTTTPKEGGGVDLMEALRRSVEDARQRRIESRDAHSDWHLDGPGHTA